MWSIEPIPGNPWPHDMTITVEDQPNILLELLWIREAHQLRLRGEDLPPLLSEAPPVVREGTVAAATRAEWEEAWPRIWDAAVAHAGREHDPRLFEELRQTANGSPERAEALRRIVGPNWRDDVGHDVFAGDEFGAWAQRGADAHRARLPVSLESSPERRDLDSLIPAWRAGLNKIVTIPCIGGYTRRITPNALLMTDSTRSASDSYRWALQSFT